MEKILLILAVVFAFLAISSRHRLHKSMEADQAEVQSGDVNLAGSDQNPESLSYALAKMTGPQTNLKSNPIPAPTTAPQKKNESNLTKEELLKEVQKNIELIQASSEDSPYAFEKALNLTSSAEHMNLRLTVFQAALNMQVDSLMARNLAIREVTSLLVNSNSNENMPPEETAQRELQRNIVTSAYKVYIQFSQDPDVTYNDTLQAINFQTDQWVRRQIIFECISRFPQLREKINE